MELHIVYTENIPDRHHQSSDSVNAISFLSSLPVSLDAISAANPRVIDDSRARKLSNDLKRCTYYETCSTYGLNVERVFQDGETGFQKVDMRHIKVVANCFTSLGLALLIPHVRAFLKKRYLATFPVSFLDRL